MKTKNGIIDLISDKIRSARQEQERIANVESCLTGYDYENITYKLLTTHFETLIKIQFKIVELLRMKGMLEYGLREPNEMIQSVVNRYTDELLSYTLMRSSTNIIVNLTSVWENEVKQELIKYYKILMK